MRPTCCSAACLPPAMRTTFCSAACLPPAMRPTFCSAACPRMRCTQNSPPPVHARRLSHRLRCAQCVPPPAMRAECPALEKSQAYTLRGSAPCNSVSDPIIVPSRYTSLAPSMALPAIHPPCRTPPYTKHGLILLNTASTAPPAVCPCSPKDVPSQDVFNPSGACRWKFARAYMHACRGGASEACCSVLEPAFLPASGAPFAGCLCQRDMWDSVVSWFDAHSDFSAAAVMLACVDEYGKRILFTGGPIGFCEAEPWSGDGHGAASRKLPGPDNAEDAARRAG
eukprot:352416-Chlamydomonas_euryale.AAC.2